MLAGPLDLLVGAAGHVTGAIGLGAGGLRGGLGTGQLLGFLGALGVLLAQGLEGVVRLLDGPVQCPVRVGELLGHGVHARACLQRPRVGLVEVCAHGEDGGRLVPTLEGPRAQHVAAGCDDGAHAGHVQRSSGALR